MKGGRKKTRQLLSKIPQSLSHTVHSSARRISSKGALRRRRRTRHGGRGRLLKGLLGGLLILGRGRGKTGSTTSGVGHDTTE